MELFDQPRQAAADVPRIDTVVVVQVLDRKLDEEVVKLTQRVRVQGDRRDARIPRRAEGEPHLVPSDLEQQLMLRPAVLRKHVSEVRATVLLGACGADSLKVREHPGNAKIGRLLGTVATRVRQGEVRFAISAANLQRLDVIDVQRISVQLQINGLLADEAVAALRTVQLLDQRMPRIGRELVQVQGGHGPRLCRWMLPKIVGSAMDVDELRVVGQLPVGLLQSATEEYGGPRHRLVVAGHPAYRITAASS